MTHNQFTQKYNGRFVDYDGKYGNQCVDLMRQYIKEVKGWDAYKAVPAGATAKVIFQNFKNNAYYKKVFNTPNNIPKQGDLIFWGTYPFITGLAGHVAVFEGGDLYSVLVFGQNYPTGKPCKFTKYGSSKLLHGYRGVMGWLTPVK